MRKLLLCLLTCSPALQLTLSAQNLSKVSMDEKINNSSVIIEGEVVDQKSFWNAQHTMIYTSNTVEVSKVFKGTQISQKVEVLTVGGAVGLKIIEASDLLTLQKGDVGVFFCYPNTINLKSPVTQSLLYDVYSSGQGYLKYDLSAKTANAPLARYNNIQKALYPELVKKIGHQPAVIKNNDAIFIDKNNQKVLAPSIVSFLPATVNAGAALDPATNLLTITGTGFGLPGGTAAVLFDDANDGTGGTAFVVAHTSALVQSWTDIQIVIQVPPRAGTGTFQVRDAGGVTGNSPSPLTVNYAVFAFELNEDIFALKEARLTNTNGLGGYTILYSNNVAGSGVDLDVDPAKATFQRALTTWQEIVGYNITEGGTTANQLVSDDGINTIMFDNTNTGTALLPAGVLGVCFSYFDGCLPIAVHQIQKTGFDVVLRNDGVSIGNISFSIGPCPPSIGIVEIDLETVILHELGHAINLGHINDTYQGVFLPNINPGKLMNFAVLNGVSRKSPDFAAYEGALYAITPNGYTFGDNTCPLPTTEMVPLATSVPANDNCPVVFPVIATPNNTLVAFDLVHTTSNKFADPQFTAVNCAATGTHVTNNAYFAMKTDNSGGSLDITVSGYGTTPASVQGTCPAPGIRLALYQTNSCPAGQAFPAPTACRTFNADGALATINGLNANANYLIYVDGLDNTKANFTLAISGAAVLPLSLISFSGIINNDNQAVLNWKTTLEMNTKEFIVEKSFDGITFSYLATVAAKGSNNNDTNLYDLIDKSPYPGNNYYRLKIVDNDNSFNYSNIVLLKTDKQAFAVTKMFPNPVHSTYNIEIIADKAKNINIELFDVIGKKVLSQSLNLQAGINEKQITLFALAAGAYVVQLRDETGNVIKKAKIVKE